MSLRNRVSVIRVIDEDDRQKGLDVLRATYADEKKWVADADNQLPVEDLRREDVSWFVALVDDTPVGIVRVLYDPPLGTYAAYEFELNEDSLDVEDFIRKHQIAEIGRFAVVPEYRRYIVVAAALMREASTDTVDRGYTHYITDVFEGDPHSPYQFHTRVMGFQPVATHSVGELNFKGRRITMVLDLKQAYLRLSRKGSWFFKYLTETWDEKLHRRMV